MHVDHEYLKLTDFIARELRLNQLIDRDWFFKAIFIWILYGYVSIYSNPQVIVDYWSNKEDLRSNKEDCNNEHLEFDKQAIEKLFLKNI